MVCDPAMSEGDEHEWTATPSAADASAAAREFLTAENYDESDFDPDAPFELIVRDSRGRESTVKVRVVPAHFEVS